MKIERTKNAKRNIAAGIVNKMVVLLLPFFVRTAFNYSLGAEYLGLNGLFTSILNVLNMTELGFNSAIIFSMYEPIAKDKPSEVCALLGFYKKVYRIIGVVILTAGLCLAPFLTFLINGEVPQELNIYALYLIYLFNTVSSYLLFSYKKSLLSAFQRDDIISNIDTLTVGLMNIAQLILLLTWHDLRVYYLYLLSQLIFTLVNNIINNVVVSRKFPQYQPVGKVSSGKIKEIKKQVAGLMVTKICQMTRNSFHSIFVSAFISLTMTAIYNNYHYVITAVSGFMNILTNAILGGIGNSISAETKDKNYQDFTILNFIYMWIAGWASITMLCLYENFMVLWVGPELTMPIAASILFSTYFYTIKIGDIRATYSSAAGLWWENRYRSAMEVAVTVLLSYLLIGQWGIYGILTGTIISILLMNNTFGAALLYKHYFTEEKISDYVTKNILYFAVTAVAAVATYGVCSFVKMNFLGLIIRGAICVMLPNMLYWLVYCKTKDYKAAYTWLAVKLKRKGT